MGDTITLPQSKIAINVKRLMSRKSVIETRNSLSELLDAVELAKKGDTAEAMKAVNKKTDAQDEIIAAALLEYTDITQEQLDDCAYVDGLFGFYELYELSVDVSKNLRKPATSV